MKPDGSDIKRLTNDEYSYSRATWSPDLSLIAAVGMPPPPWRPEDTDIYILDSLGNFLNNQLAGGRNPVWSPDGKRITYEATGFGLYFGIYIIDADGANKRKIDLDSNMIVHVWDWSKDGKRLLVTGEKYKEGSDRPESYELYEMDLNGNLVKQITDTPTVKEGQAQWSFDEKRILFGASGPDLLSGIYIMNSDGSDSNIILTTQTQNKRNSGKISWSPDGTKVAFGWREKIGSFNSRKEWANIYTVKIDGSGLTQITFDDSTDIINVVTDWR